MAQCVLILAEQVIHDRSKIMYFWVIHE